MTSPLVSVVIAAYNAARYLPETLESALAPRPRAARAGMGLAPSALETSWISPVALPS
jgi:hypothetical protein